MGHRQMIGIFLHGRSLHMENSKSGECASSLHLVMVVLNGVSRNWLKPEWFDVKARRLEMAQAEMMEKTTYSGESVVMSSGGEVWNVAGW